MSTDFKGAHITQYKMSTDFKGAHITQYNTFCVKIIFMFCRGLRSETRSQTGNHKFDVILTVHHR